MPMMIPGIPVGHFLYTVECVVYGPVNPQRISERPVMVENYHAWAVNARDAIASVEVFLSERGVELVKLLTADVVKGIVRERIIGDVAFDPDIPLIQL